MGFDAERRGVEEALGAAIAKVRPVSGGDINEAYEVRLADGRRCFVKTNAHAPAAMFETEGRGLSWLREAGALRVPEVLAVSGAPGASFLVLEFLDAAPHRSDFDDALGTGLAALHRSGAPSFGFSEDNFIGRLPQSNRAHPTWAAFYREERLSPQVERAARAGHLSASLRHRFDELFRVMEERVGPEETPSRLHGDLWGGNLHADESGAPCLIDPAVYGGHREIDLAMMRLFGGFSERVFRSYEEAWPLAPGSEDRLALYQLYPLLVHVNLFGGGYVRGVVGALERLGIPLR